MDTTVEVGTLVESEGSVSVRIGPRSDRMRAALLLHSRTRFMDTLCYTVTRFIITLILNYTQVVGIILY
jgi:hypothetical protein